jgi:hypothetical protein
MDRREFFCSTIGAGMATALSGAVPGALGGDAKPVVRSSISDATSLFDQFWEGVSRAHPDMTEMDEPPYFLENEEHYWYVAALVGALAWARSMSMEFEWEQSAAGEWRCITDWLTLVDVEFPPGASPDSDPVRRQQFEAELALEVMDKFRDTFLGYDATDTL